MPTDTHGRPIPWTWPERIAGSIAIVGAFGFLGAVGYLIIREVLR